MAGYLFEHDGRLDVAKPETAPLLADRHTEQVGIGERLDRLAGDLTGLVAVGGTRSDLALGEIPGQLAEGRLVLGLGHRIDAERIDHQQHPRARG